MVVILAAILDFWKIDGVVQLYLNFFNVLGYILSENKLENRGAFLFTQPALATGLDR